MCLVFKKKVHLLLSYGEVVFHMIRDSGFNINLIKHNEVCCYRGIIKSSELPSSILCNKQYCVSANRI